MKILIITDFFGDGLVYQENLLAKYYNKNGHDVVVVTSIYASAFDYVSNRFPQKRESSVKTYCGIKVVRCKYNINLFNKLRSFSGLYKILTLEQPDLIFMHGIAPDLLAIAAYKKKNNNCKFNVACHADYSNSGNNWISLNILNRIVRRLIFLRSRAFIDKIFAVTPASALFMSDIFGINYLDIELLPLGADVDLLNKIKSSLVREKLRIHHGVGPDEFVIFSGGKLSKNKKTELLIGALNELSNSSIHLFIVGDSDILDVDYKNKLISSAKKNINIKFVGWKNQTEIVEYLFMSDIAVFPASQSILWQQAIAAGLPLIVGDTGSQDISYLNKGNIIIIDAANINVHILAQNINKLFRAPETLQLMRSHAKKVTAKLLDWNFLLKKTF